MNKWLWPWEWDWNWIRVGVFLTGVYLFGVLAGLIGLPGVIPFVITALVAYAAGQYEWFEL